MTTPDRTEELVRAMLERRAGGTVPDWLIGATMQHVATSRQSGRRGSGPFSAPEATRVALIAAVALLLLAIASFLAVGALLRQDDPLEPPALVINQSSASPEASDPLVEQPSESDPDDAEPPAGGEEPSTQAEPPPEQPAVEPEAPVLPADSLARVTTEGDRLRVRTEPGTGSESELLNPLLRSRDRLLVLGGPVEADGYDWYRVYAARSMLAGWVAGGKDGVEWIEPVEVSCPEVVELLDLETRPMDELLACYGGKEITIPVDGISDVDIDGPCPWAAVAPDEACALEPAWMAPEVQVYQEFGGPQTDTGTAIFSPFLAFHPDLAQHRDELPEGPVVATLVVDHPDAAACRVVNDAREDLVEPWIAALRCRLQMVLVDAEPITR